MRRLARAIPLVLGVAVLGGGCATRGGAERPSERSESATVHVQNHNWSDMHLYVFAGGQRFSLGLMTSNTSREFELPRAAFGAARNLVFIADPIGSVVAYVSDEVFVQPGDRVEWTLQNNLAHSSISVF